MFLLISAQLMEKISMEALLSQVSLKGTCRDGKGSYRLFTMDQGSPDFITFILPGDHSPSPLPWQSEKNTADKGNHSLLYTYRAKSQSRKKSEIWRKTGKAG